MFSAKNWPGKVVVSGRKNEREGKRGVRHEKVAAEESGRGAKRFYIMEHGACFTIEHVLP